MVNYITSIEKTGDKYVAHAKNPENNTVIYSSRPHDSMPAALQDVKLFLEGVRLGTKSRNFAGFPPPPVDRVPLPPPNVNQSSIQTPPCNSCPGSN
jgi:hypothetical protein